MIEVLIKHGLSDFAIDRIQEFDDILINEIESNLDEVEKTISFMKIIGVKYIEDVLLYRRDFLLFNSYKVKKLFNDYGLKEIVELINEDYTNVDLLFR